MSNEQSGEQDDFFISTEELLQHIEEAVENKEPPPKTIPTKTSKGDNKDVVKFIKKNGILPGDNRVPTYVVYYWFVTWTRTTWARSWGKEEFFRTFRKHFTQVRTGKQRYYLINDSEILTDDFIEKAKKYDKRKKRKI